MMPEKSFKQLLNEAKKEYNFTVKLACDAITDMMLTRIERALDKNVLLQASKFSETPIQESPLDFPNVRHSKVFISEVTLQYPATTEMIRNKLSQILNMSEQQIAVYTENDPRKVNTEDYLSFLCGKNKEGYVPYIGRDYGTDKQEEVPAYGDEHNKSFIKELMDSRQDNKYVYNDLSLEQKVDHSHLDTAKNMPEPSTEKTLFGRTKRAEVE